MLYSRAFIVFTPCLVELAAPERALERHRLQGCRCVSLGFCVWWLQNTGMHYFPQGWQCSLNTVTDNNHSVNACGRIQTWWWGLAVLTLLCHRIPKRREWTCFPWERPRLRAQQCRRERRTKWNVLGPVVALTAGLSFHPLYYPVTLFLPHPFFTGTLSYKQSINI